MRPSSPEPTPEADARGGRIEKHLFRLLCKRLERGDIEAFCQPDAIVVKKDGIYLVETKCQEHFRPPPFPGHGLPLAQVRNYMAIHEKTGGQVRTKLVIWDKKRIYSQWIDALEEGEHFDTSGTIKHTRRIYPLESFEVYGEKPQRENIVPFPRTNNEDELRVLSRRR